MKQVSRSTLLTLLTFVWLVGTSATLSAADPVWTFDTPEQRQMFEQLTHEYRCLKCQNQTIADSRAGLADDLRHEIRDMILAGRRSEEINQYLVDRYGDFVLYRPRFQWKTLLLWLGPLLLLSVALIVGWRFSRRSGLSAETVGAEKLDRARSLLNR